MWLKNVSLKVNTITQVKWHTISKSKYYANTVWKWEGYPPNCLMVCKNKNYGQSLIKSKNKKMILIALHFSNFFQKYNSMIQCSRLAYFREIFWMICWSGYDVNNGCNLFHPIHELSTSKYKCVSYCLATTDFSTNDSTQRERERERERSMLFFLSPYVGERFLVGNKLTKKSIQQA